MSSESVSTFILIALTIAGSLTAYFLLQAVRPIPTEFMIETTNAQVMPDGAVLIINIKNLGPYKIVETATVIDGYEVERSQVEIEAEHTYAIIIQNPPGKWVPGNSKNVVITAKYTDGSTVTHIASVKIYGIGSWIGDELPSGGEQEGEGTGEGGAPILSFFDDFKDGFSGWLPWGDLEGYSVEVDKKSGSPSPALHVFGNGENGTIVGAAKTVQIDGSAPYNLSFDYRLHVKQMNSPTLSLWLRIEDSQSSVLFSEVICEIENSDSGWSSFSITLPQMNGEITIIIYMEDVVTKYHQEFWLDNVSFQQQE